ncbi:efflux RND transporter permease subunit [Granulicella mallensis]|uniref:Acriflavin resistance protein n=1 Tax=Granulicella mallensis (strain ATCC BAA-1857 / DSM 23137 / MP5ACTX8) TaxID=682795 RepID=G8NTH9_GRAMM|nr:efflux RND transporter permease subunit [Granulicella mallensis]AEU35211.1 acriflavin resistance protein [Granulicella mallensis MP5ACTX8]
MWIVRLALNRPYTFIILALLILLLSPAIILQTPTDIFPNINIPVISVAWTYTGLNPEDLETRLTTPYEKVLTTLVDNIQHIESTTYNGVAVVKIYLQPGTSLDTANAQVVAAGGFVERFLPPNVQPPEIINFSASSVPILQLGISGKGMSESQLNDLTLNFLRTQLITVPGAVIPLPYGGKQRQVMINMDQNLMQSKGVTPDDVLNSVNAQNLILPSGTAKVAESELDVRLNVAPRTIAELNNIPIKQVGHTTIYLREVARVSDGFAVQTNVVRQDGHRGVLLSILKAGNASTLDVVSGIRGILPHAAATLPPELKINPLSDQSVFVRGAISGVIREAVIAGALTGLMILLFIGSWRSTIIIAVSIPLSILTSIIVLSFLHETINIMTLGGLALAVGILVDDATVEIENVNRILEEGHETDIKQAILDGAQQIAVPALVSTLCICIVFMPLFLLGGVARYLFVPLAEAVVFAMLASYILSRTLVPTLAMYMLKLNEGREDSRNPFVHFQRSFERGFERVRAAYHDLLTRLVTHRKLFIPAFLLVCLCVFLLVPWLGQDFFPQSDSGQFILHVRSKTGMRIEETAQLSDRIEGVIRKEVPANEMDNILDNIGLPYSPLNTMHSTSGVLGANDVDILVSLNEHHRPTADYVRDLRKTLPQEFPGVTFYFLPADIVTQILNFGLPSPIDVQIEGSNVQANHVIAEKLMAQLHQVSGLADLHIQQPLDYPTLNVDVDRTKASQAGLTEQNIASSVLNTLSGSFQVTPMFFVNWNNGVNYNLVAQTPQYRVQSVKDIQNIPIADGNKNNPEILGDVASMQRSHEMAVISHYNIRRVIDVYGAVQDRDLGSVSRDVQKIVDANRASLPRGTFITIRGQITTMRASYNGLLLGLGFAIVLVYMLIVVNFQSWLDPFIIITALPAAMAGIVLMLFFTHTTLSVPALMGALMCVGVATANSILVVSFAKERLQLHGDALRAAIEAGNTRFRPVIMTALAMMIGMVPMALGLGDGGEQNAPLGRAVIGGLLCATIATLVFVPSVFTLFHHNTQIIPSDPSEDIQDHATA